MGWEQREGRGRYYTRTRRVGNGFVREYVGTGAVAEQIAAVDAATRRLLEAERAEWERDKSKYDALEERLLARISRIDATIRGFLILYDYHQHHRGAWRRKRGEKDKRER